ncbi:sushi, von Willebrand factor type A, EGF and pentraxin domain-containing protein 1-like isoform X2 [Dysidea avara]|uniref:sushi, von Willebrand factor type A, EGF and pentraxin domain-containing protein 1-like isoform X2 n=1 Tax=Dysidea avara TaxID=196820 RepID=UPI00333304D7
MDVTVLRLFFIIILSLSHVPYSDEQECTDDVGIEQIGDSQFGRNKLAIVPRLNFTCDGRITNIRARVNRANQRNAPLSFQIWRPSSPGSVIYNKTSEVQLQSDNQVIEYTNNRYITNIILTGDDRIQFQSGDVIGYYHPNDIRYSVRDIRTDGYVLHRFDVSSAPTSVNLSEADFMLNFRQSLIQFTIGIRCDNLSTPPNGEITSCSSGRVGVGYEGDTCSFTCNTGYELTGSDTRTCQSDGNWSGSDDVCRRVPCPPLTGPNNGMITCSLGDDGVPSYEDTCSFTCNTGYELTGSDTRTCQSDGNWSGSDDVCRRVPCPPLTGPNNGMITCSLGDDGVPSYEDTCSFTCNTGYELTGSDTRTCQSDGNWSGSNGVCRKVPCPSLTDPNNGMITCSLGDDRVPSYEDTCSFTCNTGYELTGSDTRTCQSDGSWSGSGVMCMRVPCPTLTDPDNGTITCSLGDDGVPSYEDTCSFTCNTGYELTGSDTRTCQSNRSWSGSEAMCMRVSCPSLTDPNNGMITCSLGDDGVPSYEDTCSFTCNTGYELTGSDTRTCQSNRSWSGSEAMCMRVSCPSLTDPNNGMITCSLGDDGVPSYEDTCSFTCNTGYELTGSDTRTCQSDESWSGTDDVCRRVPCPSFTDPNNGMITCLLGDDGVPSYEDTCNFTCNTGYELTGSDTRTCQSDGSWSGSDDVCRRVRCPTLSNGSLLCPNETTTGVFEDSCTFSCNGGYELQGPNNGTCLADQSWSGGLPSCVPLNCPDNRAAAPDGVILIPSPSCSLVYQSQCTLSCDEGFTGDNVTYLCNVTSDPTMVDWVPIGGVGVICERVQCPPLTNGTLQCPNETTTGVFEDTCTFSCNGGYELQGSNNGTCLADQSWSGGDPTCVVLNCSTSPPLDNSQLQLPCDTQYRSTCVASCDEGYITRNNVTSVTYLCDVTTDPDVVEWLVRDDASCQRVTCLELSNPNNGMVLCSLGDDGIPSYEDICSFTCNTGYELTGSPQRTCQSDGTWSGSPVSCTIMECPSSSLPMNSMLAESCSSTYQSMCDLQCVEGFNGSGDPSYLCNTSSGGSSVMWVATGEEWSCERVQCTTLPLPSNGNISCDSIGAPRYEDQCSFSCDPGYELTGSSTRQCLSNGSWSGADVTCDILHCNNLTDIVDDNALVDDCSDEFGSVCSLQCITGYMVVGNNTFTCDIVNDGVEWRNNVTGGDFQCDIVTCTEDLVAPSNGSINCSSDNQPLQYQDTCTFQCDDGYEVEGSVMRQCEASGEWSGTSTQCNILHCPVTVVANSRPCDDTSYTSTCMVECEDGYNRSEDSSQYSCGLNGTGVTWMLTGSGLTCSPVPCVSLSDPENGNVTCPSNTSVFQNTCTYYCNRGYQLEGNRQTRCSADGTWSSEPVTCTILTCNDPEVEITNSQSVGDCSSVTYGSSCLLNCSSGYNVSGNGEHVCDDVNDEGTSVKWRSVGGHFVCVVIMSSSDESSGGLPIPIIAGGAGGAGGAVLFLIILLCVIIICIRCSRKKKSYAINTVFINADAEMDSKGHTDGLQTFTAHNALYTSVEAEHSMSHYEMSELYNVDSSDYSKLRNYSTINRAVHGMELDYEYYTGQSDERATSVEEEDIYETPCDDNEDYGPIYTQPPTEVDKIYETLEGKSFLKFFREDIKTLRHLGSGEFGVVTYGVLSNAEGDLEVAMKTLNADASDDDKLRFLQEAAIMCQFDHENVIKLYGIVTEAPVMIVLEYMSRGDLYSFLIELQPSDGKDVHPKLCLLLLKFCQEIAAGMTYLAGKQFIHRDLAARNILVSEKCACKIADFGMSRDLLDDNYYVTSGGKIPVKWTAPEAIHYRKYSLQSDVWSYGCVLFEIWSLGHKPFEELTNYEAMDAIEDGNRLPPPPGCPKAMYKVMMKCWHPNPKFRPQFGQIAKALTTNGKYLLGLSEENKQTAGEDALKLGAPLESGYNLFVNLQQLYKSKVS